MAITINWGTRVISVPLADLTLVSGSLYELNVDTFRQTLKSLESSEDGMPFTRTHNHNTEVTVGGVTLARVVEIVNSYTMTFEDGQYAVRLAGANSNIPDVVNVNQVSVRSNNSAGMIVSGSGVTAQDKADIAALVLAEQVGTYGTLEQCVAAIFNRAGLGVKRGEEIPSFHFVMVDATDHVTPKTGLAVQVQIAKDSGGFVPLVSSVSEVGNGVYVIALSEDETDAKMFTLRMTAAGADPRVLTVVTAS